MVRSLLTRRRRIFAISCLCGYGGLYLLIRAFNGHGSSTIRSQRYRGKQYWKQGVTKAIRTLHETPFARFQIHQVQIGSTLIKDWMWFDESDNINVLVEDSNHQFWIMSQTKYGLERPTLSVLGGLIDPTDASPLTAAKRELNEELQLEAPEWISLGSYRASANRGGGMTHCFWARGARSTVPNNKKQKPSSVTKQSDGLAPGELERQNVIHMTRAELKKALLEGRFQEIKWTATVALALLQE